MITHVLKNKMKNFNFSSKSIFKKKLKLKKVVTIFVVILGLVAIYFIFQGQEAKAEWFNDNWMYRQKITANNNSDFDATDVPYKVLIDTSTLITNGKMQSDGDDIRITNKGGQIVRFQIEESTLNTSETGIWFEATVEDNGLANYYLYYGNPSVPSISFSSDVESESGDGATVEMKDGFGYSNSTTYGRISDIRKNGTNLGVDGAYRHTASYPGSWWDDRAFARTLLATGPLFVEVQFEDTNYGNYSSFGTIVKMFDNGFVADRVYMNYNNSGTEELYYYLRFASSTRNSVWVNGSGTLVDQAENSGNLYQADLGDSWFGQRWTATGYYGGTIVTENNSDWEYGGTSAQSSYYQTNYSYNEAYSNGESREIRFAIFAGDGGLNEMNEKGSLYGANSTSLAFEEQSPGPVAYWKFDEGADDTCSGGSNDTCDSTQNGLDLTRTNAQWKDESMCVSGKCAYYDGSSDYFSRSDPDELDFDANESFTVSAWIKGTGFSTYNGFIGKGGQSDTGPGFEMFTGDSGTSLYFRITWSGGPQYGISMTGSFDLTDREWHHVVGVINHSNSTGYIYGDGKLINSVNISSAGSLESGLVFKIGGNGAGEWDGFIDEAKIYPYARSAAQIKADYLSGSAGTGGSAASVVLGAKPQKWLSDGLVGYWKMDESLWDGTSGEVIDSSGNGNNGTSTDNASTTLGKFGNGGVFDGNGDYVDTADINDLDSISTFTFAVWVNSDSGTAGPFISKGTDTSNRSHIWWHSDNTIFWNVSNGSNAYGVSSEPSHNAWHYFVMVFDGTKTGNSNRLKGYIDGVEQNLSFTGTIPATTASQSVDVLFGKAGEGASYFDGKIDEVRIYNRALSTKEVRDLYNWAPGPVAYYNFDEKTGTTINDTSGNGNNSTAFSTPDWTQGKVGAALDFNGSSDFVTFPNDVGYTTQVSAFVWFKHEGAPAGGYHIIFGGEELEISVPISTGEIRTGVYTNARFVSNHGSGLTDGNWHHIGFTFDGSTKKSYIDGKYVGQQTGITGTLTSSFANRRMGRFGSSGTYYLNGLADDARIYNYVRTPKQIVEDMNAGHPAVGSPVGSQVGYWKFDEGYGDTAYDSSIHNNGGDLAGTCPGADTCPSWTNNGKFGKALSFDGGDYVSLGSADHLEMGTGGITLSLWVKADSFTGYTNLFYGSATGGNHGYGMMLNSAGEVRYEIYGSTGGRQYVVTDDSLTADKWYHLVMTFDHQTNQLKLYINGEEKKSNTLSDPGDVQSPQGFIIGSHAGTSYYFDGLIDEIKIYPFALTQDEIKLDYNQGASVVLGAVSTESDGSTASFSASREYCVPGDATSCSTPVAEWKLDEKTGTSTIYDKSGNDYDGTMNGSMTESDWVIGKYGSALDFDGTNDYISFLDVDDHVFYPECGTGCSSCVSSPITISLWMKLNTSSQESAVIGRFDSSGSDHWINYGSGIKYVNGAIKVMSRCNADNALLSYNLSDTSSWHHIVATLHTTEGKLYVDGVERDSGVLDTDYNYDFSIAAQSNAGVSFNFDGRLDDIKIYSYIRTPAQITWDYNRGGPVGWWKLDTGEGITAYDASGNSNNGTLEASMTSDDWVEGKYNTALDFDGGDDYVEIPDNSSLEMGTGDFSISAWINALDQPSSSGRVVFKVISAGGIEGYNLAVNSTGYLNGYIAEGGTSKGVTANSTPLENTGWHQIIFTVNRDSATGLKLYVDGVETTYSVQEDPSALTADISNSEPLTIARNKLSPTNTYFNGKIDDVRIYNYALTEEQIKNVMNQGAAIRFAPN